MFFLFFSAATAGLVNDGRKVNGWITSKKSIWFERKTRHFARHDGKVFGSRNVKDAKGVPEHHILALNVAILCSDHRLVLV